MKMLAAIATVLISAFVCLSIHQFGLRKSYIAFSTHWKETVKIHNVNIWGLVTVVVALLMFAPAIAAGAGHGWQPVCFLLPASLAVIGLAGDRLAGCFADLAFWALTIAFVVLAGYWPWLIITPCAALALALTTRSLKVCYVLWIDLAMMAAACGALLT